ncbi:Nucleotidyltransferase domain-containing protein [Bacillus sp. 491mf]|uniref:nucleotidyltransferase domain-containing protein n=1 Tax=Bacillus TaxID=1386 RepID=UPI00054FA1E9|nr:MULTISPECIES: nucleotidyltransferase domain-containing protein [unclassified Bacillus (in: firmicutes)]SFD08496.1 Nucleotidyltransferase domain-containing protein [Bacillus sp. 491mf]
MAIVTERSIPKEVEFFLNQYVNELQKVISKEKLVGVYVYGSLALNAFHLETSDIDFVTVMKEQVSEAEKVKIRELHKRLRTDDLGKRMDGMYIPLVHVGKQNHEMSPYLYCSDGKINEGHWDINSVTWWTIKNSGITFFGQQANELPYEVTWDDVVSTMKYNVEQYWSEKVKRPYLFLSTEWVESAVVTMGRIMCTLEMERIVSKDEGLQYMMKRCKEWEPLLQEVYWVRQKEGLKPSLSRWRRAQMTKQYLLFWIEECKKRWER